MVQLYVEGLCHGNLSKEEAIGISNILKTNFPVNPLPTELRHAERVICLPSGANLVRDVSVKNKSERNSVAEVILVRLVVFFTMCFVDIYFLSLTNCCSSYFSFGFYAALFSI